MGESGDALHVFKGQSGNVHVFKDRVFLERQKPGCLNFLSPFPKVSKTISLDSITAIQVCPPDIFGNSGFIQFTVPGGKQNVSRVVEAIGDENSVSFRGRKLTPSAQKVHDLIFEMKHKSASTKIDGPLSVADEIKKLKGLLDEGALTSNEFELQKTKLLSGEVLQGANPATRFDKTTLESIPTKPKSGWSDLLAKGCLIMFAVPFLMAFISSMIAAGPVEPQPVAPLRTFPLNVQVSPQAKAVVKVDGPMTEEKSGAKVSFQLSEGSYDFKVRAEGYETYQGSFHIPKNKNLAISLKPSGVAKSQNGMSTETSSSPQNDPTYPFKLVTILSQPTNFNGMQCFLEVEGEGWQASKAFGGWYATLRRSFGENEVSCLLESADASTVQRVSLEAEFYQPGLYENEMLLQFGQSSQVLMHPMKPPQEFAEALVNMTDWSNSQWELVREPYENGGFGLTLRKK